MLNRRWVAGGQVNSVAVASILMAPAAQGLSAAITTSKRNFRTPGHANLSRVAGPSVPATRLVLVSMSTSTVIVSPYVAKKGSAPLLRIVKDVIW